jgi:hypothetical protein
MSYTVQKQELQQCRQEVPARSLQVFSTPQHHQFVCGKHQDLLEAIPVELIVKLPTKRERERERERERDRHTRTRLWILPLFQELISDGTQKIPQSLLWMIPLSVLYITKTASTC